MNDQPDFFAQRSTKIPISALPHNNHDRLLWLQLARSRRVGPATFIRLIREAGSAALALQNLPRIASAAGARGYAPCSPQQAEAEMEAAHTVGATMLCLGAPDYPPQLALIPDPPPLLWAIGDPALAFKPVVGLVGARNASSLGQRMARKLAQELGESGFVIASGLARGIDTAAHHASIKSGTIAVLAGGVDNIYPRENKALWQQIAEQGVLLSEAPMGSAPQARHFPRRNRIISGVALGVVIIEGALKSGSLITARDALDQGREVMAVPGSPLDPRASGCNVLLRDGAGLVRSGADVIEYIAVAGPDRPSLARPDTPRPVLLPPTALPLKSNSPAPHLKSLLGFAPTSEDTLIRETGLPTPQAIELILEMELAGEITRHPGGLLSLAK
ncbi:MAG: DNA-processing protein DprA [Rhodobacteraceae bacterium]|nr:DNA-processing protein DprA [Paracoccaceae bacterium]